MVTACRYDLSLAPEPLVDEGVVRRVGGGGGRMGGGDLHTDRRRGRVVIVMLQIQMMSHLVTSRSPSEICVKAARRDILCVKRQPKRTNIRHTEDRNVT